jgi:hypothetical protein
MKKTVLFVLVGVLCTAALFAVFEKITYVGKNCGQKTADNKVSEWRKEYTNVVINAKLPKGSIEIVNGLLNRYDTSKGDTFLLEWPDYEFTHIATGPDYYAVCEFTSDTEFIWWTYACSGRRW